MSARADLDPCSLAKHSTDSGQTWSDIADYTDSHPHEVVFSSPHPRECQLNRYRVRAVYGRDGQSPWKTANMDAEQLRPGYDVPTPSMAWSVAQTVNAAWKLVGSNRVGAIYTLSPQWGNRPSCVTAVQVETGSFSGANAPALTSSSWGWTTSGRVISQQFGADSNRNPRLDNPGAPFVVGARVRFVVNGRSGPWSYVFWRWGRLTTGPGKVKRALSLNFYRDLPEYDPFPSSG